MKRTFIVTVELNGGNIGAETVANAVQQGLEESSQYWRERLLSVTVESAKE